MPQLRRRLGPRAPQAEEIERAVDAFQSVRTRAATPTSVDFRAVDGVDEWQYEELIDLVDACRSGAELRELRIEFGPDRFLLERRGTAFVVTVTLPTASEVLDVVASLEPDGDRPAPTSRPIFIGHGRNQIWRVLSDHLRDHGFDIATYENTSRPSQPAMEVLGALSTSCAFAILIHTAEVRGGDDRMYAGSNVAHETGLFQAILGVDRTLIVREQGCEPIGNVAGLTELRFPANDILPVVGQVVTALRRTIADG